MDEEVVLDGHFGLVELELVDGLVVVDDQEHDYNRSPTQTKEGRKEEKR